MSTPVDHYFNDQRMVITAATPTTESNVNHTYWNDWYFGWGWFLWFGIFLLMFSSIGNWGYTYRAHRKYGDLPGKEALDILNARYARGEISREEWGRMKLEIARP